MGVRGRPPAAPSFCGLEITTAQKGKLESNKARQKAGEGGIDMAFFLDFEEPADAWRRAVKKKNWLSHLAERIMRFIGV